MAIPSSPTSYYVDHIEIESITAKLSVWNSTNELMVYKSRNQNLNLESPHPKWGGIANYPITRYSYNFLEPYYQDLFWIHLRAINEQSYIWLDKIESNNLCQMTADLQSALAPCQIYPVFNTAHTEGIKPSHRDLEFRSPVLEHWREYYK